MSTTTIMQSQFFFVYCSSYISLKQRKEEYFFNSLLWGWDCSYDCSYFFLHLSLNVLINKVLSQRNECMAIIVVIELRQNNEDTSQPMIWKNLKTSQPQKNSTIADFSSSKISCTDRPSFPRTDRPPYIEMLSKRLKSSLKTFFLKSYFNGKENRMFNIFYIYSYIFR